jgi:23S rRNA (cytosine1962-C5)-methyltransferase
VIRRNIMLQEIELSKEGSLKTHKGLTELYYGDLARDIKFAIPGEWVYFKDIKKNIKYLGYVNPLVGNGTICGHVLKEVNTNIESEIAVLRQLIDRAIIKRKLFKGYEDNSRLVYGDADGLPGLLIDSYVNYVIIQINTAGIDRFRRPIKDYISSMFADKAVIFLDNPKYRENEMLPYYNDEKIEKPIEVFENNLKFKVLVKSLQKVGYYYDHRENRRRVRELIESISIEKNNALDLFCYVGSWGLNLLYAGVKNVDFVDQGDFEENIEINLEINKYKGRGQFQRANVFEYLKDKIVKNEKYNIICSDPPAFCKSKKEKQKAYEGYVKLHKLTFDCLASNSLFIACSCTQYVNFDEFEESIAEAAKLAKRKYQLIDTGLQGYDHPTKMLKSKNTYLKYFVYFVE